MQEKTEMQRHYVMVRFVFIDYSCSPLALFSFVATPMMSVTGLQSKLTALPYAEYKTEALDLLQSV